jgi:AraC family transcriptional regulator
MAMRHRHLEFIVQGRRQRAASESPLLSSAQSPWSGFLLERHAVSAGDAASRLVPQPRVVLVAVGSLSVDERARVGCHRFVAGPGSVTIRPRGHETRSTSWTPLAQPCEALDVEVDVSTLARLAPGDDALEHVELIPQSAIEDPALATLLRLIEAEVAAGCPTGRLYGESLSLALAAHLAGRYATAPVKPQPTGGLSRHQLRRVLDYVRAHLGGDLSLPELSGVIGLSAYHFFRAFRASVGVSPHQHVIGQRIGEARRLLAARRLSIAEVALALGFADQSHFAEAFRKATGTTPGRYRQES